MQAGDSMPMFFGRACSTESQCQHPMPVAGTVSNLAVGIDTAPASGRGWRIVVRRNADDGGTPPSLYCDISSGSTSCSNSTDSLVFAAGDLISIKVVTQPGQSTPSATPMRWAAQFAP